MGGKVTWLEGAEKCPAHAKVDVKFLRVTSNRRELVENPLFPRARSHDVHTLGANRYLAFHAFPTDVRNDLRTPCRRKGRCFLDET